MKKSRSDIDEAAPKMDDSLRPREELKKTLLMCKPDGRRKEEEEEEEGGKEKEAKAKQFLKLACFLTAATSLLACIWSVSYHHTIIHIIIGYF